MRRWCPWPHTQENVKHLSKCGRRPLGKVLSGNRERKQLRSLSWTKGVNGRQQSRAVRSNQGFPRQTWTNLSFSISFLCNLQLLVGNHWACITGQMLCANNQNSWLIRSFNSGNMCKIFVPGPSSGEELNRWLIITMTTSVYPLDFHSWSFDAY